ncbi:tyrosine-type recombinase/integrase [Botrimarina mediterranea]|uniref:Site-specific tyrosine recombinase XerC n=1 Tax=Botrimarina mediterranea TaxID=2528022 RepID=A0A518KC60_9BACT|nr:site-specific integrase [Botrimarina mediterranea]QDV75374.1 site-specific tyrosine recombinase XerC [Botrimarina mediterranea]
MPRLVSKLPTYRRHKASGQAVVTLCGVDHYLGPYGSKPSRVLYDRLVAEWLASGRSRPSNADASALTIVELAARYWEFAVGYYQKDGRSTGVTPGIKATLRYLNDWYGREPADQFGPLRLKALRDRMIADGHSRNYINDHVGRIKRMFKWAVSEELVTESTYHALAVVEGLKRGRTTARETARVLPIDDAIVQQTLTFLPETVADMVRLQRLTGMRPAEVCLLRPCDLDRSRPVWIYRPESHKTEHHGRDRWVFVGPQGQELLDRYLDRDPDSRCFQPRDSEARRRLAAHAARVTPPNQGDAPGANRAPRPKRSPGSTYHVASYRRAIHRACDKAGVARWSPNRLRHAAATEVRAKFGLEAAQVVLGHAGADVTQIYAERDLAKGLEVAAKIG